MPLGDYVTTEDSCSCPAFQYRPGPCKHIDQVREVTEHLKQQGEIVKVSPRTLPDGSWGVAVNGGRVQVGQTVTVESNNGKTWSAVITEVVEDKPTHQLCATCKPEEWTGAPPAPAQAAPAPAPAQTTEAPLYPPETPAQARQPAASAGGWRQAGSSWRRGKTRSGTLCQKSRRMWSTATAGDTGLVDGTA